MRFSRVHLPLAVAVFLGAATLGHAQSLGIIPPAPTDCTATTTTFSNTTPTPIPDLTTITSTINVSGVGPYLWDLNLQTFITHTDNGDLAITLTSPAGTTVTISTHNAKGFQDVFNGTVWDDDAGDTNPPGPVTLADFVDGVVETPLVPEGAMAAFAGENPNGTWTLTVADTILNDSGTLNSWTLEITSLPAPPSTAEAIAENLSSVPIPDDGTLATSTIDFPSTFPSTCRVRATTNIEHPNNFDLEITLVSPAGTKIMLSNRNGGFDANVFDGTEWRDDAPVPVTDYPFTSGVAAPRLQPEAAMGAFIGEDPTGTWTLGIRDHTPGNVGTLNGWTLNVENCTCDAPAANAPLRVDENSGSGNSSDLNGVFEPGETVQVEPSWTNPSPGSFSLTGAATNFTGPAGPTYTIVDGSADYGSIASLATSNCFDATADCFGLGITIGGPRPAQHWDATFDETVTATPSATAQKTWVLHIGESFPDVPTSNQFYKYIETIFHNGVTGGCSSTDYCPDNPALRKQMAVFVLKSKDGKFYLPPPAIGIFADVPTSDPFAPWIEELYHRGVVGGCTAPPNPNYCPDNPVLRQQMAVFLLKTRLGRNYVPPACTGVFADVPCPGTFSDWIEDLFHRGIAAGCGGGNYCPTNPNTRGQMAVFLTKTFGLLLYGP